MIDLPAPVSPVSTLKPGVNSISSCSIVAKLVTLRSLSMAMSETPPFRVAPFGLPKLTVTFCAHAKAASRCGER